LKRLTKYFFIATFLIWACTSKQHKTKYVEQKRTELYTKIKSSDIENTKKVKILDSILRTNSFDSKDTLLLWSIMKKSNLLYRLSKKDSVFYYDKLLFKKASSTKHMKYIAISSNNIGLDFDEAQQFDSAYYYYNLSKNNYLKLEDSVKVASRLLNMGNIQKDSKDLFGAKETATEALYYLENFKNPNQEAKANNLLGTINRKLLNFEDAIVYHEKAIELEDSEIEKTGHQNNLGLVYLDLGNYSKAISIFKQILKDSILDENSSRYARILHNLTVSRWYNGDDNVEQDFLRAIAIRKETKDLRGLVSSYATLGEYYSKSEPSKAKRYLDTLIQVSKQVKMPQGEVDALELYMKLEPQNGTHKDRYIFLKDSLYQQELKVKTQFAKMKYDDEQEKARLLALEAETAQKEAQLAREETQKILLLSLLALLLMGGGSYYFILRQRHKKKTLQEIYETEKKISKKIHDGLANDVYGVMTAVQHQNGTANEMILDQLEDIYQRTRDISHDTRELSTGEDFAIELKDMLQGFSGNGTKVLIKGMENISWERLSEHKCVALHRTLKELLVNMKKHSGAGLVALNFKEEKRRLQVDYSDNGIGVKKEQKQGVGLQNTENRIQSVGGKFIFGGVEGKGVKVTLSIPV